MNPMSVLVRCQAAVSENPFTVWPQIAAGCGLVLLALWSAIEALTYSGGCALYVQSWPVSQSDAESVTATAIGLTAAGTLALLVVGLVKLRARQKTVRLP